VAKESVEFLWSSVWACRRGRADADWWPSWRPYRLPGRRGAGRGAPRDRWRTHVHP